MKHHEMITESQTAMAIIKHCAIVDMDMTKI